jgi:hypothetical protein
LGELIVAQPRYYSGICPEGLRISGIPPEIVNNHLRSTNTEGYPGNNMLSVNGTALIHIE